MTKRASRCQLTGKLRRKCLRRASANSRWLHLYAGKSSARQMIQLCWGCTGPGEVLGVIRKYNMQVHLTSFQFNSLS